MKTEKLPLPVLFNAFAPKELRNAYDFRSGNVTLDFVLKGKLKDAVAGADFILENLNLGDKARSFEIKDNKLDGKYVFTAEETGGGTANLSSTDMIVPP